jgi:CARDB
MLLASVPQPAPAHAQSPAQSRRPAAKAAASKALTLDTVRLTPSSPAEGALCQLAIAITNHGAQAVSRFRLEVKINGRAVDAYALTRYLQTIEPGQTRELRLFNVRAERGGNGSLRVDVAILGADYVMAATDSDGVRTWRSEKPVPGLPASAQKSVALGGHTR